MAHGKAWMVRQKRCWPACKPCFTAYRQWSNRMVYRRDSGKCIPLIDPEKSCYYVREMVDTFGRQKIWIARVLGMSDKTVSELYIGRRVTGGAPVKGVRKTTEAALAALHAEVVLEGPILVPRRSDWVPIRLTQLGLQGLRAQGWDGGWIAERIGSAQRPLNAIALGEQTYVTQSMEDKVLALVREVGSTTGPSARTATIAARRGWKPTMYYDELV